MSKYKSIDEVPEDLKQKLTRYFTSIDGDTFVIKDLPPELTGSSLARYSRAPTGMRVTTINEFLDEHGNPSQEKGADLINRVLNAFGHDSVAELEGAHVGIQGISQLITNEFEDRRIGGSPIEQSTRYVMYDKKDKNGNWKYIRPKEIVEAGFLEKYERVNDMAFELYSEMIPKLKDYFKQVFPEEKFTIMVERDGEMVPATKDQLKTKEEMKSFNTGYRFTIRCAALDVGRCVLPASTSTQLGIFGNGRYFKHLLTHLKTVENEEANERGFKLETELNKIIPTFIQGNERIEERIKIDHNMKQLAGEIFRGVKPTDDMVTLVTREDYLVELAASMLFPYTNLSLQQVTNTCKDLPFEKLMEVSETYKGHRELRRDRTGRGIEAGYPLTFDLVGTFAEYRDLERHRILTQQRQDFSVDLGFVMPPEIGIVGLEDRVQEVVGAMQDLNQDLKGAGLEKASQYATLFNNRIRFMLGMNLREFQHLTELRTVEQGHFGYRMMAMEMVRQAQERYPWIDTFLEFVNFSDPGNKISRATEQAWIAGNNLADGVDSGIDL